MSVAEVSGTVEEFVADGNNDLLVIKGAWGVGKTHFWQHLIENARNIQRLRKPTYAYVSLFGVNDIAELKNMIFVASQSSGEQQKPLRELLLLYQNLSAIN